MRKLSIIIVLILMLSASTTAQGASFDQRVDSKLTGGRISSKSMAVWELYQYRDTTLLRKYPMKWCPWQAYVAVNNNVTIEMANNRNYLCINADLVSMLKSDANFNRKYAKGFKTSGSTRQQVKQIYRYCKKTTYEAHTKTTRSVFTSRKGDCAGISGAFYVLCKAKGIPVRYVIGWTESSCHAWNRVRIDGKWYWIDCTQGEWLSTKQFEGRHVMEMW